VPKSTPRATQKSRENGGVLQVAPRHWRHVCQALLLVACASPPAAAPSPAPPKPLFSAEKPRYPFRGMHLDVARHFFPKEVVERYVDLLAFYKYNYFHWHLTDDQGFRLELKKHPELTAVGGTDGFYTQNDVREVVAYARARGITVIPEIEMPGHARAILAAHPELSCTGTPLPVPRTWGVFEDVMCVANENTLRLVDDILDEVVALFPGPYIHVGGDEVPPKRWSECPKEKALGLPTDQIEGWFMERVVKLVTTRGKRAMVWDEAIDPRLPKDVIVVAWQSRERGDIARAAGYEVVLAPYQTLYFNFHQSRVKGAEPGHEGYIPWSRVRAFDPGPGVLGAEGTLWTEYVTTQDDIDLLVAPRIAALADVLWTGPDGEKDFPARFIAHRPQLDALGIKYFVEPPALGPPRHAFIDRAVAHVTPSPLFADLPIVPPPPLFVERTTELYETTLLPNGRTSPVVRTTYERQTPSPARAKTFDAVRWDYFEGDFRRLPDFAALSPDKSGNGDHVELEEFFRAAHFAVRFETYFEARAEGVYRVVARADDGVRVTVDDKLVVEDDGMHEARDAEGEIALATGPHLMRVFYFQGGGGKALTVRVDPVPSH